MTKGRKIFFSVVGLLVLVGASKSQEPSMDKSPVVKPVVTSTLTSSDIDASDPKLDHVVAGMAIYHVSCRKLPEDLANRVVIYMKKAGQQRMSPALEAINEARMEVTNTIFCAAFRDTLTNSSWYKNHY
jgi:hypothetical protein